MCVVALGYSAVDMYTGFPFPLMIVCLRPTECLRDLQRLMRRDSPTTRDVFFQLGAWDIVGTHLVPLMRESGQNHAILLNAGMENLWRYACWSTKSET